jgi:glycosyltransferase involved in cell wall biosynthesis
MRIAYFSEVFLPKVDGVVNTLCHLFEYLEDRGHKSILFTSEGGPSLYDGTHVIGLKGYAFPGYPELRLAMPKTNLRKDLDEFKPDLIHVVNPVSLGWAGLNYGYQIDLPVVASYHTDIPGFAERWGFGFLRPLIWHYFRLVYNIADLTLAPSNFTAQQIGSQSFQNVKVWSRGVDAEHFSPAKKSQAWRVKFTDGYPGTPILIYVGRLAKEKRIHLLYDLIKQIPEACLAIVGDGPARAELEKKFSDTNTIFTGYLRGEDLAQAYASADIFVFTGANETFGNVVFEAMASGLPVVVPKSGGVMDLIRDQENGFLFAPDDGTSLFYTIKLLINNPSLARRMGKAGRAFAKTRSWEKVMDELIDYYRDLMRVHKRHDELWRLERVKG